MGSEVKIFTQSQQVKYLKIYTEIIVLVTSRTVKIKYKITKQGLKHNTSIKIRSTFENKNETTLIFENSANCNSLEIINRQFMNFNQ